MLDSLDVCIRTNTLVFFCPSCKEVDVCWPAITSCFLTPRNGYGTCMVGRCISLKFTSTCSTTYNTMQVFQKAVMKRHPVSFATFWALSEWSQAGNWRPTFWIQGWSSSCEPWRVKSHSGQIRLPHVLEKCNIVLRSQSKGLIAANQVQLSSFSAWTCSMKWQHSMAFCRVSVDISHLHWRAIGRIVPFSASDQAAGCCKIERMLGKRWEQLAESCHFQFLFISFIHTVSPFCRAITRVE